MRATRYQQKKERHFIPQSNSRRKVVYLYQDTGTGLLLTKLCEIKDNCRMNDDVQIGRVLKHLMNERKMTFKKLSELSGVPISTIKTWSAGIEPKSFASARKVARTLGVTVEFLVFGNIDKTQPSLQDILTTQLFSGWCKVTIEMPVTSPVAKHKKDIQGGSV